MVAFEHSGAASLAHGTCGLAVDGEGEEGFGEGVRIAGGIDEPGLHLLDDAPERTAIGDDDGLFLIHVKEKVVRDRGLGVDRVQMRHQAYVAAQEVALEPGLRLPSLEPHMVRDAKLPG